MDSPMRTLTKIDRLAFSVSGGVDVLQGFMADSFKHIGQPVLDMRGGAHGFRHSAQALVGGAQVAWMAWGGTSQKGRSYADVSGQGCGLVADWEVLQDAVTRLPGVRVKRVDIAADFYRGEVTYDRMLQAHSDGGFCRGGRNPEINHIGPPCAGSPRGRTLQVGVRGNDVSCRGYEKGKKEFGDLPADVRERGLWGVQTQDDRGAWVALEDWFRVELELHDKSRAIAFDVIQDRDLYFAGAYPFLQEILPSVEPRVLVRPQLIAEASLERALWHIKRQYGSTLFTAVTAFGGDVFAVWERIVGSKHNRELTEAGALLLADQPGRGYEVATVAGSQARH